MNTKNISKEKNFANQTNIGILSKLILNSNRIMEIFYKKRYTKCLLTKDML